MIQRACKFSVKELADDGSFTGLAAVYGNVDQGGDVIDPGAFTKTIAERGGEVPVLWQHDSREPIGLGTLKDSSDGLVITGKLTLASPTALKAYALLKDRVLRGLSIGYDTVNEKVQHGVRYLKELKLYEVSLVTFPMNERALVSGVKSTEELDALLAEVKAGAEANPDFLTKFLALAGELTPRAAAVTDAPDIHALCKSIAGEISWNRMN